MKNVPRSALSLLFAAVIAVAFVQPAQAEDTCCFNNFRFAGGCQVRPTGGETCASILAYLNSFDGVGRGYCGNTTVRGGWTLVSCAQSGITPGGATVQESRPLMRPVEPEPAPRAVEPGTAPTAQEATLIETSAPMKVRFDSSVNSTSASAGQLVIGHLEEDLKSGSVVIAPKGSEVQAQLVPTSFWTSGGGDAFAIQATSVKVGDQLVPVNGVAIEAQGGTPTHGAQVSVPEGTLVSFETEAVQPDSGARAALEGRTGEWVEAFNSHDADRLTSLYAEDAVVAPPNAPAVFGRDAIRAENQETFATGPVGIELEDLEIVIRGDLAYKAGRYRLRSGDSLIDRGKYLEIWRFIDGEWMLHRDIYNSSLPLVEAAND